MCASYGAKKTSEPSLFQFPNDTLLMLCNIPRVWRSDYV